MQTDNPENKVVSLFDRAKSEDKPKAEMKNEGEEGYDFETIMKRNAENKGRQSKAVSQSESWCY